MRLAPHPRTSPWFRSSLLSDVTLDEIERTEPLDATLSGIAAGKHNDYYRALITRADQSSSFATGRTAAEAFRNALRYLDEEAA